MYIVKKGEDKETEVKSASIITLWNLMEGSDGVIKGSLESQLMEEKNRSKDLQRQLERNKEEFDKMMLAVEEMKTEKGMKQSAKNEQELKKDKSGKSTKKSKREASGRDEHIKKKTKINDEVMLPPNNVQTESEIWKQKIHEYQKTPINEGTWVAVYFDDQPWFGKVTKVTEDMIEANFLECICGKYRWPRRSLKDSFHFSSVLKTLQVSEKRGNVVICDDNIKEVRSLHRYFSTICN
ncbi:uncharacterized protein LOC144442531 [Glandiceps talaboti]